MRRIVFVSCLFFLCGCAILRHGFNLRCAVENREDFLGLVKDQVRKKFGKPDTTYTFYGQYGTNDIWVYNYKGAIGTWTMKITLVNGEVVNIDYF